MRAETILIVDDEKLMRWSLAQELAKEGYLMIEAATMREGLSAACEHQPDLIVLDQRLPDGTGIDMLRELRNAKTDAMVVMLTVVDRSDLAVQAMKLGAFDYITKPVNPEELRLVVEKALETTHVKRQLAYLREEERKQYGFCEIIGSSPAMTNVLDVTSKIAQSNTTTVLITGESGTGKELVARAIHNLSDRRDKPWITVSCSAVPESLVESELFGHEKGAFTDAKSQKKGLFELAHEGSIFLDEVGDMTAALQVKLLRVLEEKTFRRVGGTIDISVDVRVIAATNQLLEQRVEVGKFRPDLYYRLNVASIQLPPLWERGDDVLLLAEHFLQQYSKLFHKNLKGLSPETQELFRRYRWPGNVRELKNVLERAVLLHEGEYVFPHQVELGRRQQVSKGTPAETINVSPDGLSLEELEREAILKALQKAQQNQSQAARLLKISRDTLRYRVKKYGLTKG
ncbi:MAG: sigma-54-dependent transcriptional regulator [Bacteroidota bacterium]